MNDPSTCEGALQISHYWICCAPFFETTLLVMPPPSRQRAAERSSAASILRLYDADGYLANEVMVEFSYDQVGVIELEPLMAGCKFQAGLKHGHLEVHSPPGFSELCRIHTREGASQMSAPVLLSNTRRVFFPLLFSTERVSLLCLINAGETEAVLRGRFFCAKRSPEATWEVPGRGARVISLTSEFSEYLEAGPTSQVQAYIRIGVRNDCLVGAQLIDRTKGPKEGSFFSAIS